MISGLRNAGISAYTKVAENPKKTAMFVALALIVAGAHKKGKLNTASLKGGLESAASKLARKPSWLTYTAGAAFTAGVAKIAHDRFGGNAGNSTKTESEAEAGGTDVVADGEVKDGSGEK